jgi:heme-degrading monooxygenase HmoA/nitroimidazol reductase NimA-like FMN-containing flavoprotein (pyridoxamine 5'-phosphate oxidase superfamily)
MTVVKINAITVPADSGDELARRFAARAGAVDNQPGFEGFELLKPADDRATWLVVTRWRDEDSFQAWVASPAFGRGHQGAGGHAGDRAAPVGVSSELWSYEVAGGSAGNAAAAQAAGAGGGPGALEVLDEEKCRRLIAPGGLGRIAYSGRYGLTVLPVNYKLHEGSVVFRTEEGGTTDEDLRTGIAHAEYRVTFEIDQFDASARTGWSVLIQGSAHHVDDEDERETVRGSGVEPWAGGHREMYVRITPSTMTGRRVSRS